MSAARHFLLAVQFFTRIPVTGRLAAWVGFSPEQLRSSAAYFPAVGWIVGAVAAGVYGGVLALLPPLPASAWIAAVLSTAATAMLTGAFHEDGLADLSDGLGGSLDRERALEIMKDSRIGTFGALAVVLALLAKVGLLVLLSQVNAVLAAFALFGAHVMSRFLPLVIVRTLPHVGDTATSKSKPLADAIANRQLAIAAAWWIASALVLHACMPGRVWLWGALAAAVALLFMLRLLRRRLQGFTGDGLGATQQACEITFYFGVALSCA